jgi:hypothetical protein
MVLRGQRNGSPRLYSRFSWPEPLLFVPSSSSVVLTSTHEAEWTPFQTHCLSENLEVPGIEPRTSGSVARNSDHILFWNALYFVHFPRIRGQVPYWNCTTGRIIFQYVLTSNVYISEEKSRLWDIFLLLLIWIHPCGMLWLSSEI